jgi:hypothetical protein
MPCTARAAMSTETFGAAAHSAEAMMNPIRLAVYTRSVPNRRARNADAASPAASASR